jgi:Na+/melibiose symporter-like transporter
MHLRPKIPYNGEEQRQDVPANKDDTASAPGTVHLPAPVVVAKAKEEQSADRELLETLQPGSLVDNDEEYTSFTKQERLFIMFFVCMAGLFSPLSALIYFPALEYISRDIHVSIQLMNLTITTYLIVQGIIPSVLGDLADQFGRRPVYLLALALYFAANIGLAIQNSYPALLLLRMVQSAGSSGKACVPWP